jgi:hypothetical protein
MPYPTLKDINPSLKGIRPRIDLDQANQIAAQADAIGADKGGWGIAIKTFKKSHTVRGGKWTKREVKKMDNPQDKKETAQECYLEAHQIIPLEVVSFSQLQALQQAGEVTESLQEISNDFSAMLNNIIGNPEVVNKLPAIETLTAEFLVAIRDQLATEEGTPEPTPAEAEESLAELAESEPAEIVGFVEAEPDSKTDLAYLNVVPIRPGWGNTRDNNYYAPEMLQGKSAEKFIGAKMYATDHRQEEKNANSWVSTVISLAGFTETGAPITRVAVHDPIFAQKLRNLNSAGLLNKMECSILASGKTVPFELQGRKGHRVTEIVEVASIDWVTRAGAGGHALSIAENDKTPQPASNDPVTENVAVVQSGGTITEDKTAVEEVTTEKQVEEVTPVTETPAVISEKQEAEPEVKVLAAEAVKAMLAETRLPEITKERFMASVFKTEEELKEAIEAEKKYISKLTGAGLPFGLSETAAKTATETKGDPGAVIDKFFYNRR